MCVGAINTSLTPHFWDPDSMHHAPRTRLPTYSQDTSSYIFTGTLSAPSPHTGEVDSCRSPPANLPAAGVQGHSGGPWGGCAGGQQGRATPGNAIRELRARTQKDLWRYSWDGSLLLRWVGVQCVCVYLEWACVLYVYEIAKFGAILITAIYIAFK